jgi:hypothetical protein
MLSHTSYEPLATERNSMGRLYFDASAINWLAKDPNRSSLLKVLSKNTCSTSIFTIAELASTPEDRRRVDLLSVAKELSRDFRPLAMPKEILFHSASAFVNRQQTIVASMSHNWDGLWDALNDPTIIDKSALDEVQAWKSAQQKWYQDLHDKVRPQVQAELSTLSTEEKKWITEYPSRLLKHFLRDREFVLDVVSDLSTPALAISRDIAEGIIDNLDPWRFFLAGMAYGMYCRSLKTNGYGKHANPGSIDTQQAIYLAGCDQFITADQGRQRGPWGGQLGMMRTIIPFGVQRTTAWHYNRLKERCLSVGSDA